MKKLVLTVMIWLGLLTAAFAQAVDPGRYVVTATTLNVRLAADTSGKLVSRLRQAQFVEVLEIKDGWARISEYYDGAAEGLSGRVAR